MPKKIYILIPAYNEEASLAELLEVVHNEAKKQSWDYKIIACDDGSSDKTQAILKKSQKKYALDIITHKINRGLGETARDLFEKVALEANDNDVILRVEGDNTHNPSYMTDLVNKIDEGYDVVVASRFVDGGGQTGLNKKKTFISNCANLFMKFFFPIKGFREYSCGFRAYRASIIKKSIKFYGNNFIQLKGLGFTCTLEKLVKLRILKARFAEVPFVLQYDKKISSSKMVGSITMLGYIVMVIVYYWPWGGWRTGYGQKLKQESI